MLDIHIGESKDIAAKRTPRCQFDETTHVKIFVTANFARTSYPKLSKLEDYYADASFSHEELPKLIEEINETIKLFSGDRTVIETLQMLRSTCEAAVISNQSLFCFSD